MKEQKMGKYKALKEYIEKCQAKNKAITVQNDYPIVDLSEYMQVNRDLNALLKEWHEGESYTKEEILKAGEIGEVSMIDVRHVVSLLDEARVIIDKA